MAHAPSVPPRKRTVVRIVVVLLALVGAAAPFSASWVERVYSRGLYPPLQQLVTFGSNGVPIALLDVAVALLVTTFGVQLVRDWRQLPGRQTYARALGRLVTSAAVTYLLFLLSWGLNYRRLSLESKLDFDQTRISHDAAVSLSRVAIERLNAVAEAAHATPLRIEALEQSFADTQVLLGDGHATTGRPKRSLAGLYFRYAAIDGMTVPIFLEVILNPDLLPVEIPSVLAHEWAHLAGYADESEASFISWLTGIRSGDPASRYSAWLHAYALATRALPRDVRRSLPPLHETTVRDFREIAARHGRSSPVVRAAARGVYDSYLKAHRIEEGLGNYEVALQLMLGTRFDGDWTPSLRK